MSYAAHNQDWAHQRGYGPGWNGPPVFWAWHPMWIVLMILGFIFWWPLGLIILGITIGSRKMGCWGGRGYERWQDRMQEKMDRMRAKMDSFGQAPGARAATARSTNIAPIRCAGSRRSSASSA